ncbi:MAG: hypothetical protein VKK04_25475, partial [Synechococcales bacterium]|nr:hypothetical protein [Synechococcales bacterium]
MTEYPNRDRPDNHSSGEYPPSSDYSQSYPPNYGDPASYPAPHETPHRPGDYGEDYHQRRQALQLEAEERRLREEQRRM